MEEAPISFLFLPAEVRLEIYGYCIAPPLPSDDTIERYCSVQPDSSFANNVHLLNPHHSLWPGYPTQYSRNLRNPVYVRPRCQHPRTHLYLLQTCRQIHQEFWPIYASIHSWHFSNPLKFANEFLSRLPPQRLSAIRHLRISLSREPLRLAIDGSCWMSDVRSSIRSLVRVWKEYPELQQNLEELEIECSGYYYSHYMGGETTHLALLFQVLVQMLEEAPPNESEAPNSGKRLNADFDTGCELECCRTVKTGNKPRTHSGVAHPEQHLTDRYLIWIDRKDVDIVFLHSAKPLMIHVKPMCRKDWNKLPQVGVVGLQHLIERENFAASHPNTLIDALLKKRFWKIRTVDENPYYDPETDTIPGDRNWKVIFGDTDYSTPIIWQNAIRDLRLEQLKQETTKLSRLAKSKKKTTGTTDGAAVSTANKKISKTRKRPKRKT